MLKDHLNKLEYFCAVVEHQSLLKASKYAFVSQPQLSKIIRQLEEELECQLLIRNSSGVLLTTNGEKLYRFARKTIDGANETQLFMNVEESPNGEVRIGTYDSISRYFFPDFLKYLKKVMPDLSVELSTGRSKVILKKLKKEQLDAAVVVKTNAQTPGLNFKKIYSDSFGFYQSTQLSTEFEDDLIVFLESLADTNIEVKELGFEHIHSCDNLETVKSLTELGIGVGLLPHRVAREGLLEGKMDNYNKSRMLADTYRHDIVLAYNEKKLTPSTEVVLTEIERFLKIWSKK